MRVPRRSAFVSAAAGLLLVLGAGCSAAPTFPTARVAEALTEMLTEDRVEASVRFIDHTVAVQVDYPGALLVNDGQVTIGPGFDEVTRKVLTALHRVLLSTDAEIRFYVMLLSDRSAPGVYLTMVRYMDDIRRANANMIDTPEMFARTIFELNVMGPAQVTLEEYVPRDIRLEEFLSWQLARRIQQQLTDELESRGVARVGRCGGQFENGEFDFTLDVSPAGEAPLNDETMRQVFETSTNIIAKVLSSYQFESFEAIRLIHPPTGRNLVLPKARLEVFR